ncbi:MAG: hypothetical protein ACTSO2_11435 [Promethearchaeota archaeon]
MIESQKRKQNNIKQLQQKNNIKLSFGFGNLLKYFLVGYAISRNRKFMDGARRIYQFSLLGFSLVALSIPFYYFGFKTLGVSITTIVIGALTIIVISILNISHKEEDFNLLSFTYLLMLLVSTILVGFAKTYIVFGSNLLEGIVSLIITLLAWIYFIRLTDKSSNVPYFPYKNPPKGKNEILKRKISENNFQNKKQNCKFKDLEQIANEIFENKTNFTDIIYSVVQNFYIHIIGILGIILICIIGLILPENLIIAQEVRDFFNLGILNLIILTFDYRMFIMSFICTFLGYLFIFISATNWPSSSLKHDQWNSILALLEPLLGLFIGYFIWNEEIRIDYMILTTIILICAIFIRYFYEANSLINIIFFAHLAKGVKIKHMYEFRSIKEFSSIKAILGAKWDLLIEARFRSLKKFYSIYNYMKNNKYIDDVAYFFINKIID